MTSSSQTNQISNLSFKLLEVDNLQQSNLMVKVRVFAWSGFAAAWQDCVLTTDWLKAIGNKIVAHSYDFESIHSVRIDERFFTAPLDITLYEANSNGRIAVAVRFFSPDTRIEDAPCSVLTQTDIGLLETFGNKVKHRAQKGKGIHCAMNPFASVVPDYRYLMRSEDQLL